MHLKLHEWFWISPVWTALLFTAPVVVVKRTKYGKTTLAIDFHSVAVLLQNVKIKGDQS